MVLNLLVATRTLFKPHRWRHSRRSRKITKEECAPTTQHWEEPIPGTYEYVPGRGWFLIGTDESAGQEPVQPEPVVYSKVLKRFLLKQDYDSRKSHGTIMVHSDSEEFDDPRTSASSFAVSTRSRAVSRCTTYSTINSDGGSTLCGTTTTASSIKTGRSRSQSASQVPSQRRPRLVAQDCGFFRLDDGIAWVKCWDAHGEFVPGPYERWCIDRTTGNFRKMLKGDCPEWQSRRNSLINTAITTPCHTPVTPNAPFFPSLSPPSIASSSDGEDVVARSPTLYSPEPMLQYARKHSHTVPVIELPSEDNSRPGSPLSHHYKTPLQSPLATPVSAPILSEMLQQAHEQAKREAAARARDLFVD